MSRVSQTLHRVAGLQRIQVRWRSTAAAASLQDAGELPVDWDSARPYADIPGPKKMPIVGNVWNYLPGIGKFSNKNIAEIISMMKKEYGPIVKLGGMMGGPDMVFVFEAEDLEKVLRNEGVWPVRRGADSLDYYFRHVRKNHLVSLIAAQGQEWQTFRTAVNQVMMQPKNTKQYVEPIDRVSQEFIDRVRNIRGDDGELPDYFFDEITKWSLESITYVALDTRLGLFQSGNPNQEAAKMIECVRSMFKNMYKLDVMPSPWRYISTPAYREFMSGMEFFTSIASKYVNAAMERLQSVPKSELEDRSYSVLENLLLRSKDPDVAVSMALDMLLAGVDTTSMVSGTVMYQLANNPEQQRKLQEELDRVVPDPSKPLTKEQHEEMKYLRACIKETMRVMPIVLGTLRCVPKDSVVHGYQVPKDTIVSMSNLEFGVDSRYFPRPDEFLPERWLPGNDSLKVKHPFAFLPFGFGPRMCVGRRFADLEIETIVAKMFRNFELQWNRPPVETDFTVLLHFKSPLKFTVKDRLL